MKILTDAIQMQVKFSDVDSLGIVWHGKYVQYFEDGREAFGSKYGISYGDIYQHGYAVPVVKLNCDYKKSLRYGDIFTIETTYVDHPAAKLIFYYKLYNADRQLMASGETIQVFLKDNTELSLNVPEFFLHWKSKWLL